jgi:uncharacterized protein with FMN-binding domain
MFSLCKFMYSKRMKKIIYSIIGLVGVGVGIEMLLSSYSTIKKEPTNSSAHPTSIILKDGTYTGDTISTEYGPIQVAAILKGGIIKDITFIQLPLDRQHSVEISAMAKPVLLKETIQAQHATVDIVSGATQTSEAYIQSLQSALSKAH